MKPIFPKKLFFLFALLVRLQLELKHCKLPPTPKHTDPHILPSNVVSVTEGPCQTFLQSLFIPERVTLLCMQGYAEIPAAFWACCYILLAKAAPGTHRL